MSTSTTAVFDCMIFLQALAKPTSSAGRCVELVDNAQVKLFLSSSVLSEIHDVLTRETTLARFPSLSVDATQRFMNSVQDRAMIVPDVPDIFRYERDPKDEKYINLALAAHVAFLVTRDKDLLDLARQDIEAGRNFAQRFPQLAIVTPEEFLARQGP